MKRLEPLGEHPVVFSVRQAHGRYGIWDEHQDTQKQRRTVSPIRSVNRPWNSALKALRFDLAFSASKGCYPNQLNQGRFRGVGADSSQIPQQASAHDCREVFSR